MVELVEEAQYYAIIGRGDAPSDPSGLARRIKDGDETVDQSLRRDLSWGAYDGDNRMGLRRGSHPGFEEDQ